MNRTAIVTGVVGLVIGALIALNLPNDDIESTTVVESAETKAAPVRWKMASTFPGSLTLLGEAGLRLESRLALISNGEIEVKFFEPGALVPAFEVFDAVSAGSVDAGWSSSGYWAGKMPAAQVFNSVPFGPLFNELIAWMRYGEGQRLYEELYHPYNVHPLVCFFVPQDGSGWFREPINSTAEFAGLKIRYLGFGARVLEKFGASTQILAGGDIYTALELGTIDATEFSMPAIDLDLGFYQIAKHYYLPGWHQPANMGELIVNLDRWNALAEHQKALIETLCGDSIVDSIASGEAAQFTALEAIEGHGVTIHRWSPEMLAEFERQWVIVAAETAAEDEDFARVWASLSAFRERYTIWRDYGAFN
ncbi:MAG: TRAP transporter substrate-binding protein [Alphaproteobacteria bacterium]|jgi:TRAP-type mannitol/chloroaromatic compound transport system substrate-binding protein